MIDLGYHDHLPQLPPEGRLTEADRTRIILDIARRSDNPTIVSALDALLVATQMTHADEIALEARFQSWIAHATSVLSETITEESAHKAVHLALTKCRPSDLAALANFMEITMSPILAS